MDVILHTPSHKVADQVADRLEVDIPKQFPRVVMAGIRPHYADSGVTKRIVPVTAPDGELAGHMGASPWFLVETIDRKAMKVAHEYVENPYAGEKRKKGFLVGRWLLDFKPDQTGCG